MDHFLATYAKLHAGNLDTLDGIYAPEIRFIDPAHEILGLDALKSYFAALYARVTSIDFRFSEQQRSEDAGYVQWTMSFSHPRLNSGKVTLVDGASFFRFAADGKVFFHRDYFDLGALLYERLPLVGPVVTAIKRRMGT